MDTSNTLFQGLINETSADFNSLSINGKHIDTHISDISNTIVDDINPNISGGKSLEVYDNTASNLNVKLIKSRADEGAGETGYLFNLDSSNNFSIKKVDDNTLGDKVKITNDITTLTNDVVVLGDEIKVFNGEGGVPAKITVQTTSSANQQPSKIDLVETNFSFNPARDYGFSLEYKNGSGNPFSIRSKVEGVDTDRILIPRDTDTKIQLLNSGLNTDKLLKLNSNNEITSCIYDETQITTNINNISNLESDLADEESNRAAADATLQGNINTEATTRASADTTLQNNIDSEATARSNADTTLQGNIDTEATTRASADTTLQNNIDGLETVVNSNTSSIETNADDIDTLQGITTGMSYSSSNDRTTITNDFTVLKTPDATLRITSQDGNTSKLLLNENSDNYGFSLSYDGSPNTFHMKRHNNSATGDDVMKVVRSTALTDFYGETRINNDFKLMNETADRIIYLDGNNKVVSNTDGYTYANIKHLIENETDLTALENRVEDVEDKTLNILTAPLGYTNMQGQVKVLSSSASIPHILLESQNSLSDSGPHLELYRYRANPSNGNYLGSIHFDGTNSNGNKLLYAKTTGKIQTNTAGDESGIIETAVKRDGSNVIVQRQNKDTLFLLNDNGLDVDGTADFNSTVDVNGILTGLDKIIYRPDNGNKLLELTTPAGGVGLVYNPDISGETNRFDTFLDSSGQNFYMRYADNSSPVIRLNNPSDFINLSSSNVYFDTEQLRLKSTTDATININASNDDDVSLEFTRGSENFGTDGTYDWRFRNGGGAFYLEQGDDNTTREHTKYQRSGDDLTTETNSKFYVNSGYLEVKNPSNTEETILRLESNGEYYEFWYEPDFSNDNTGGGRLELKGQGETRMRLDRSQGWLQIVDIDSSAPVAQLDLVRSLNATDAYYGNDVYTDYRLEASGGNFFLKGKNSSTERQFLSYFFDNNAIGLGNFANTDNPASNTIGIGSRALYDNPGLNAIAIGEDAGWINAEQESISIGKHAGRNGIGQFSVAIGTEAGSNTISKDYRVDIGYRAGFSNCQQNGVAIGRLAGEVKQGHNSLDPTGNPSDNASVAIGYLAGNSSQGFQSCAIGLNAGASLQGYRSVAIGAQAGYISAETYTTCIGYNAGASNAGNASVNIGYEAGFNSSSATGRYAIAIGERAGYSNQQNYSVAIGSGAGRSNLGQYSICIGRYANSNASSHSSTIVLNASGGVVNSGGSTRCYIKPIRNANFANTLRYDTSTAEVGWLSSSRDTKKNITDMRETLSKSIYKLRAREFEYKEECCNSKDNGYIAEEVQEVEPEFVLYDGGKAANINWNTITTCLVKEIQQQRSEIDELKNQVSILKNLIINKE